MGMDSSCCVIWRLKWDQVVKYFVAGIQCWHHPPTYPEEVWGLMWISELLTDWRNKRIAMTRVLEQWYIRKNPGRLWLSRQCVEQDDCVWNVRSYEIAFCSVDFWSEYRNKWQDLVIRFSLSDECKDHISIYENIRYGLNKYIIPPDSLNFVIYKYIPNSNIKNKTTTKWKTNIYFFYYCI